jgi:uncharacterized membrane protein
MKPLFVLLGTFTASLFVIKLFGEGFNFSMAGRIAMSAMLIFTAVGHYVFVQSMTMMIPSFIPFKKEIVYLTGIIEVAAAIGLLIPKFQNLAAWLLLLFFLLILPANINAAINKLDYQKGTTDGDGLAYLWFRVPLQIFFMVWVYFFAIRLQ